MHTEPPFIAPQKYHSAAEALAQVQVIYAQSIAHLRACMQRFVAGDASLGHVRASNPRGRDRGGVGNAAGGKHVVRWPTE